MSKDKEFVLNFTSAYQVGHYAESQVASYLVKQGLRIQHQNFRCRLGEIDLVAWDKEDLVFLEVRYRNEGNFGGALASVTKGKQRTIRRVAQFFLIRFPQFQQYFCRFDVVAVNRLNFERIELEWVKNAF